MDPRMIKIGKGTTEKERVEILDLIREFKDTFAWNYDELKAYRGDVIQHAIPLTEGAKPFQQKLRHINPKLASQIQKELQKMVDDGIIAPIRYSSWMSNLVVVRKKNGDIRLCVDFHNPIILEGQLSPPKYGTFVTKSYKGSDDVHAGWIL